MIAPAALARFRRDRDALLTAPPAGAGPPTIGLAVSGGPDSMAMLALAHAADPRGIAVATVDHRLRAGSADEAAMVARWCEAQGVPHATLVPAAPIAGASLQARARAARYAALLEWARGRGLAVLLTAHHADDQAETFLMRAARGSGLAGLAGIRRVRVERGVAILRPLLGWRAAELREIAGAAGMPVVDDPANRDDRHDRTRFRRMLADHGWLHPARIAGTATMLAEADGELRALVDMLWEERSARRGGAAIELGVARLPREPLRRLVRRAIGAVRAAARIDRPAWSDSTNIEPLLRALEAGSPACQAGVLASPDGLVWRFAPAPPRRGG